MKCGLWMRPRTSRLVVILGALLVYLFLAFADAQQTLSHPSSLYDPVLPIGLSFGFSLSVALISLAVGSLIWFYSRNRQVSFLLFAFSSTMMIAFELETSASITPLSNAISGCASLASIVLLAVILLIFPKNYLKLPAVAARKKHYNLWQSIYASPTKWYILGLFLSFCCGIFDIAASYFIYPKTSFILDWVGLVVTDFALIGSLITVIITFRKSTPREREQLQFFVVGVILALAPLLLLTIIPQTINIDFISPEITTLTVILLPLSLGYSILRYQILVFDSYIRRTVSSIIAAIFLTIVTYSVYILGSQLAGVVQLRVVGAIVIVAMALLAPLTWWLAKQLTERVLFKETLRYRRIIDRPVTMGNEVLDLENIGQLIIEAAMQTFKTTQLGLFVLAKDKNVYYITPPLLDEQNDEARRMLATRLVSSLSVPTSTITADVLELQEPAKKRLVASRRPLLLYEVTRAEEDMPTGLSRYLTSSLPEEQNDPLIVPIRVQGKMIALLALGERIDAQSYAGPDFEIVELLISRYAAILETARMTEELRAAYERQRELDVLKDQFIMTASHELRTPLTAVLGFVELLGEYNATLSTDTRANFIAKAHRGCDELVLMVNNIMDASRVQADVDNIKVASVSLEESVVHIVEIIEALAQREHRAISVRIPPRLFVVADVVRLRQVLLNLVSNALKYSPSETNIEIFAEADTEYVTVYVRDYGFGIPLEDQNRLFERFARLERDMNSPIRGAGLGLYICKQLIEAMGGNIGVQSTGKAGEGSFFCFTLRLAPAEIQVDTQNQQNLSAFA